MKFAVVGHPLDHSKSPAMFQAAFATLGLAHEYIKEDIFLPELPALIEKVRTGEYAGLSVTVPYKEAVIPFLDVLTPEAAAIKAVNTVFVSNGKVVGDNTDWIGFKKALLESIDIKGKKILLCGAGGAARACLFALKGCGCNIFLTNRTESTGKALAEEFSVTFAPIDALPFVDILVNATSAGLIGKIPVPEDYLSHVNAVFDLLYGKTPLIARAKEHDIPAFDGKGMLLYQGAEQFKRFTGIDAPLEIMRKAIDF
jgi:shikimate dehydrogenase